VLWQRCPNRTALFNLVSAVQTKQRCLTRKLAHHQGWVPVSQVSYFAVPVAQKIGLCSSISKKNFFEIFTKMTFLRVILCEKSIACIPEAWKCFLTLFQRIGVCIEAKIDNF
jgi:hypothetical protein